MKICFIANLYPPLAFGGATGVAQMEAEHLAKEGNEVFVITTSPDKNYNVEWMNNVKIYRLPPFNLYTFYENFKNPKLHRLSSKILWHIIDTFNLRITNKINEIISKENPKIVHVHNFKGLSTLLFNKIKTPLVFTAHDYSILCPRANLLRSDDTICKNRPFPCSMYAILNKALVDDKVDAVIFPSKFLLNKFRENNLFKRARLIRLPNPINLDLASKSSKSYDRLEILYVGELAKHKGVHILIKAFNNTKNATLHIYGKGMHEDYFKKMAKNNKRVIFHGYAKGFEELKEAYNKANLTVVPSIYDNSPMVVYESFMNSTPVAGSRIGGIPELIKHGYNGFLFEPGSINELTEILREIAEDPGILKSLERNAFKTAEKYDIKKHVNKLEEIYKSIME